MVLRFLHLTLAPAALLAAFVSGSTTAVATSPRTTLRIESLSQNEVVVRVSASPPFSRTTLGGEDLDFGVWPDSARPAEASDTLVLHTPAVVHVGNLVFTLNVTVLGSGAVALHLGEEGSLQQQPDRPWGRDITLVRANDHQFHTIWKVHRVP